MYQTTSEYICKGKNEFTNIVFDDEFKNLALQQIVTAQDVNSPFYLSKLTSYELYHDYLRVYFLRKYNKKPTQTDNLAFILLLTYPERMIKTFKNFKDLKLAFNNITEDSDFESSGFQIDETGTTTCICNEDIINVHIFQNKYSGISIQLGSVCNDRYGLISKNDEKYKSTCKKIKEAKERKKEREQGLPEGYFENERKRIKEEKDQNKLAKNMAKELNKLNKKAKEYDINSCLFCEKKCIYNLKFKLCICSVCIPEKIKENKRYLCNRIKNKHPKPLVNYYCVEECVYCDVKFISENNCELCCDCCLNVKIKNCKMCKDAFCIGLNNNDEYCEDCETQVENCLNCSITIYKNIATKQFGKCDKCYYRFINKLVLIECRDCEESFEVPEKEKWRTYCNDCYKDNLDDYKCVICQYTFKRLNYQTWKTKCIDCYKI